MRLALGRWSCQCFTMATVKRQREVAMAVRMTEHEARMARELAEIDGLSLSDVLRMAVRRAYEARFGAVKPARAAGGKR